MNSVSYCVQLFLLAALAAATCERGASAAKEPQAPQNVAASHEPAGAGSAAPRPTRERPSEKPATAPKSITIDDVEGLSEVEFAPVDGGMRAAPKDADPEGFLAFVLPDGVVAAKYKNFAQFVAGKGWGVYLIEDGQTALLDGEHSPERCTIVGGVGETARAALKFGFERRDTVDGAIVAGLLLNANESYKKRFPIAIVAGGRDGVAPRSAAASQYPQYPSQSYLLTIQEANHAGYYEDRTFDGDGEALVSARQQRLILGEVTSNMVGRFCLTRETRLAEASRKAARKAAKTEKENTEN